MQSFAYVFDVLAVLTVVHVAREHALRIVNFRPASEVERSPYLGWLEEDFNLKTALDRSTKCPRMRRGAGFENIAEVTRWVKRK